MERREIEIFLALSEELHFGRTAERLYVSQARVSQTIAALERRFGVALFERTSRRVALTPVGRRLATEVRAGHGRILAAVAAAVEAGRGIDTVLTVALEAPAVADLMADVVARFRDRFPRVEVRFVEADFADPATALDRADVDVLVTNAPVVEPDLVEGPVVVREPAVLAVARGHALAGRDEVSVDDLGGQVVLRAGRRAAPYWHPAPEPWCTPGGATVERGPSAATFQDLVGAVARGEGVCPLGAHAADYFSRPTIAFVPFADDAPPVAWCLAWRAGRPSSLVDALALAARG
ncbi:LysR family transcriptional regulator [Actinomycetospora flava]|uniref:LysR family transcriptional regulator n=1 Tax=Actinomycetospora flava TaxID=3129232 RepID=A0ABU8MDW2_9PSEU